MVQRRERERTMAAAQLEFSESMQSTASEDEAYEMLRRHLKRQLPLTSVIVLNRNNSRDRLEVMTELGESSELPDQLAVAAPRACMAVRFGRMHEQDREEERLLSCHLCSVEGSARHTCQPLLVGPR